MGLSDPLCLSAWDCQTPCACRYGIVRPLVFVSMGLSDPLCLSVCQLVPVEYQTLSRPSAKRTEDGLADSSVSCAIASVRSAITVYESHGDSSVAGTQSTGGDGVGVGGGWGGVFLPSRSDRDVSEHKQINTNNAVFNSATVIPVLLHSGVVPLFCLPPTVKMVLNPIHRNHKAYN